MLAEAIPIAGPEELDEARAADLRPQAELLAAELHRRAEAMDSHLLRAAVLLAQAAPDAATQLLQDLDETARSRPELDPGLQPLRAAVAAELAGTEGTAA